MRTLAAALTLAVLTVVLGSVVLIARLVGVPDRPGAIYEKAPRWWARGILAASGIDVVVHGAERARTGEPRVFASNHVSWYDVLVLVATLPRCSFVAKAELFRVPLFGAAARAVNTIPIDRDNRMAAFASYEQAAEHIRAGRSVVVYPEGTRGQDYAIRPFKKGPFVLAIAAGVPIVPTLIHGTLKALPRGSLWLRPGRVDVHLLAPVATEGLDYDARDVLAARVHDRLAAELRDRYGVPLAAGPVPPNGSAARGSAQPRPA